MRPTSGTGCMRSGCARQSARSGSGCDRTRLLSTASSCGTWRSPAGNRPRRGWDWSFSDNRPGGKPSTESRSRCIVRSRGTGCRRPERARRSTGTAPGCDRTSPLASSTRCGNWCNPSATCWRHGSDSSLPRSSRRGSRRQSPRVAENAPLRVAGVAVETRVRPRELKRRRAAMVERGARPRDGRVATGAVLGEARLGMVGIPGGRVLRRVATETILRRSGECAGLVAGTALNAGVGAVQGEARELVVVEAQRAPVVHAVALRAVQRNGRRLMVEGLGLLVVLQVAG